MRKAGFCLLAAALTIAGCRKEADQRVLLADICKVDTNGKMVCTIFVSEKGKKCSVTPEELPILSGDKVIFATDEHDNAEAVKITKKRGNLRVPLPGQIGRGRSHDAGELRGNDGDIFVYGVEARDATKQVCVKDPEICIKSGARTRTFADC